MDMQRCAAKSTSQLNPKNFTFKYYIILNLLISSIIHVVAPSFRLLALPAAQLQPQLLG